MICAFILIVALPAGLPAAEMAGYTPGSFAVDGNGAAGYSVPIQAPPGFHGMTPSLSLNYNSQGGDGMLGIGWSLSGLSEITRGPATIGQDGFLHTVNYDNAKDRFYLNGMRLNLMSSGNYGAPGTVYRPEFDDFTRIVFDGTSFTAHTKDGQTVYFSTLIYAQGTTNIRAWVITDRYDRLNNRIHYDYSQDLVSGEYWPVSISYKYIGNNPVCQILFNYAPTNKPQPSQAYIGGSIVCNYKLLTHIITKVNGVTVRDYALGYDQSYSGRSRLRSVIEYDGNGNNLKPTYFDWQASAGNFTAQPWITIRGSSLVCGTLVADFDGDGRTDLVFLEADSSGNYGAHLYTAPSSLGGSFVDHGNHFPGVIMNNSKLAIIDSTGRGTRSIVEFRNDGKIYVHAYTGGTFLPPSFGESGTGHDPSAKCYVADLNGDGKEDIFELVNGTAYAWTMVPFANNTINLRATWGTGLPTSNVQLADVNGDGMMDLIGKDASGVYAVWLSTGSDFQKITWSPSGGPANSSILKPGAFLGDGKTDVLEIRNGMLIVWPASGAQNTAFAAPQMWLSSSGIAGNKDQIVIGDYNSDGRADITDYNGNVFLSTGIGFSSVGRWASWGGYSDTCRAYVGDMSGHGNRDLILINSCVCNCNGAFVQVSAAQAQPDLMTAVTNGIGNKINITYESISNGDSSFYTAPTDYSSTYSPKTRFVGPLYVVQQVQRSNGINGGLNSYLYTYSKAHTDLLRRRFLGFESILMRDLQNRTDLVTFYNNAFPYTGLVSSRETYHYTNDTYQNGSLIRSEGYAYGCEIYRYGDPLQPVAMPSDYKYWTDTLRNTSTYFPYVSSQGVAVYDLATGKLVTDTDTTYTYDPMGLLKTSAMNTTAYANDSNNTQTAYSRNTIYWYWPVNQTDWDNWNFGLVSEVDTSATNSSGTLTRKMKYTYWENRLLQSEERDPDNAGSSSPTHLLTTYTYDGYGNMTSSASTGWDGITGSVTRTTSYTHTYPATGPDGPYAHVVTTSRTAGTVTLYETKVYSPYFDTLVRVTDPNGLTALYTYDGFGRRSGEYLPDGTYTIQSFLPAMGGYGKHIESSGKPAVDVTYDELDREVLTTTTGFDGTRQIQAHTVYNAMGLVAMKCRPHYAGATELTTTYQYDDLGRLTDEYAYDTGHTTYAYNQGDGMTKWVTNVKGQVTKTKLDAQGMVVTVKQKDDNITVTYTYDAFGNLLTVTKDGSNKTIRMAYDILGRKITMSDPDMGDWSYVYNAFGELSKQTDANGKNIVMEYDELGRLTHRAVYSGTVNMLLRYFGFSGTPDEESWRTYDTAPRGATAGNTAEGLPATIQGSNGFVKSFAYDDLGRISSVTQTINGASYAVITEYDALGRIYRITYPATGVSGYAPLAVQYGYTSLGYLQKVCDATDPTKIYWQATRMDDPMRVTEEVFGAGFTSQLTRQHTFYAATARLQNISSAGGGRTYQNLSYTYDDLGNVLSRSEAANSSNVLTETFEYDALNRLTQSKLNDFWKTTKNYAYAENGNIASKTGVGLYFYLNGRPHAVSLAGSMHYAYDDNGNMIQEYTQNLLGVKTTQRAFEYNADNMLTRAAKGSTALAVLTYDPDNALITEDITAGGVTTSTVKIGDLYEKVATGTLTEHRHYIMAGDGLVAIRTIRSDATADRYYVLDDHLGSVSAIVRDATGLADNKMSYAPFGQQRNPGTWKGDPTNTTLITRRGFTGHVQLDAVGLIHMKGRCYDPELGRFLTPDPFVQAPYDSQSLNRYSYCLNNPLSLTDPTGYWSWRKFAHSVLRGIAFGVGLLISGGNPIVACALSGAVGGLISGGGILGAVTGGMMGMGMGLVGGVAGNMIGGVTGGVGTFSSDSVGSFVLNAAQIGYSVRREGWDALGYMAGGMIGQGMVTGTYNMFNGANSKDTTGSIDGQQRGIDSESTCHADNVWATDAGQSTTGYNPYSLSSVVGKIWNFPNTVVGLAWGGIGMLFGAQVSIGNNAIQFINHPFMPSYGAITMGNTISYGSDFGPGTPFMGLTVAMHEIQHTYQGELLGPAYLPSNIAGGVVSVVGTSSWGGPRSSSWNWNEWGPYSSPPKPW